MTTSPDIIQRIDELAARATPRPWSAEGNSIGTYVDGRYEWSSVASTGMVDRDNEHERDANAAFIVALANAWPEIRSEIEALRKERDAQDATIRHNAEVIGEMAARVEVLQDHNDRLQRDISPLLARTLAAESLLQEAGKVLEPLASAAGVYKDCDRLSDQHAVYIENDSVGREYRIAVGDLRAARSLRARIANLTGEGKK